MNIKTSKKVVKKAIIWNKNNYFNRKERYSNVRISFLNECLDRVIYILNHSKKEMKDFNQFLKETDYYRVNNYKTIEYYIDDIFRICLFGDI